MPHLLILGAQGGLGSVAKDTFLSKGWSVTAVDRTMLDITKRDDVLKFVIDLRPDVMLNAAAFNDVDAAEDEAQKSMAMAVNGLAPGFLSEAAQEVHARMVHVSTDYVFSGEKKEGYQEDDAPSPISFYGETKFAGEEAVKRIGGNFLICRTSRLFGPPSLSAGAKPSFVSLMLKLAEEKPSLDLVDEEEGCPTYTVDLASAILRFVEEERESNIYHLVNSGPAVTWYGFANEIFALKGIAIPRRPVLADHFPRLAKRPKFSALVNTKTMPLHERANALERFLA